MKLNQHICDNCKKPVNGFDQENIPIQKDFIMFKGQMAIEMWNDDLDNHEWFWVTKGMAHEVCFCDLKCLSEYIEKRRGEYKSKVTEKIRNGEDPYSFERSLNRAF